MTASRHGLALVTVFLWIALTSSVLTLAFAWTAQKARWGDKIQKATDHLYLAEGILAGEVNRLKRQSWLERWYRPATPQAPQESTLNAAAVQGSFEGASYTGYVQDVVDPWFTSGVSIGPILENHTDLFLKVKYPGSGADEVTRSFFYRVVLRQPNPGRPTPERPTAAICRRFAETETCDPLVAADRGRVLAGITRDEISRERLRAESHVYEREIAQLERDEVTPDSLWRVLKGLSDLDRQVRHEGQIVSLLRAGQRLLTQSPALGTPNRIGLAREAFNDALSIARSYTNRANRAAAIPRCLYAAGRGEWMYARTLSRRGVEGAERVATILASRTHFEEILRSYPWKGVPTADPGGAFPRRLEAPHAYVPLALTLLSQANPDNPVEYNAAINGAIEQLEKLRQDYPDFHLWDEDAITGTAHAGPSTKQDETVWYLEQLLYLPVLAFGGRDNPLVLGGLQTILQWTPSASPSGGWRVVNTLLGIRLESWGTTVTQLAAKRGEQVGDRFLIVSIYAGEPSRIYDAVSNTIRPTVGGVTRGRNKHRAVLLPDGRVAIIGGDGDNWTDAGEIFDPSTETFGPMARMTQARVNPLVTRLRDGRVLVVGSSDRTQQRWGRDNEATAEVYDPASNSWSPVANRMEELVMNGAMNNCPAVVLDDGSVLIAGCNASTGKKIRQLFLPDKNRFWPGLSPPSTAADVAPWPATPIGEMIETRTRHWAVKLNDGRVLLGNGQGAPAMRQSTELYDPASRTFSLAGNNQGRGVERGATVLPDGKVLVTGGYVDYLQRSDDVVDVFDPVSSTWAVGAPLPVAAFYINLARPHQEP